MTTNPPTRMLPLVNGRGSAILDEADYQRLKHHRWYLIPSKRGTGHVQRVDDEAPSKRAYLHREVLGLTPSDPPVDHINQDGLDNRRCNLRLSTNRLNKQNLSSYVGSTSQYRGVSWESREGKWRAQVRLNGAQIYREFFEDELTAARHAAAVRVASMPHTSPDDRELAAGTPTPQHQKPPPHVVKPSPCPGVTYVQYHDRWRAQISHGGRLYYLGQFKDQREAVHIAQVAFARRDEGLPLDRSWVAQALVDLNVL